MMLRARRDSNLCRKQGVAMRVSTTRDESGAVLTCGCRGRERRRLAQLGSTPGVYICRFCALWAWRRASRR